MSHEYQNEHVSYLKNNFKVMAHAEMAKHLGKSEASVRNKCWRLGLVDTSDNWTMDQIYLLKSAYEGVKFSKEIDLPALALKIGKHKSNVCRKARSLGLTDIGRPGIQPDKRKVRKAKFETAEDRSKNMSLVRKEWFKTHDHPRGALGLKHSVEAKAKMSSASAKWNSSVTQEQRTAIVMKQMQTRVANGTYAQERPNASWKAGWREIGGIRKYYRSKWEANYAFYLQWLKENGQIDSWLHEPVTFWFVGVKRGCVSYLPDFWVKEINGSEAYHEVKGWMDDRSKTKIRRMAKYHPKVRLIVIDSKGYAALKKSVEKLVPGWEV